MPLVSRSKTMMLTLATLLMGSGMGCGSEGAGTSGFSTSTASGMGGASSGQNGSGGEGLITVGSGGTASSMTSGTGMCDPKLVGVIRDFKGYPDGHPDFEHFAGSGLKGIVQDDLGADRKPVYAHNGPTAHTTGKAEFDQWFRDVPEVNKTIPFTIQLTPGANGIGTFDSNAFFPIDGQGWGDEGFTHNYGFTYELHMVFQYSGKEVFSFTGDDDLWVFVNNKLAIDLGGLHSAQSDTLDVDARAAELGIVKGKEYSLDLFQAERHSDKSNFKVQSSLNFTNCNPIIIPN